MKLYKKCKRTGFVETINTDGEYRPKGWSLTKQAAQKKLNKMFDKIFNPFKRDKAFNLRFFYLFNYYPDEKETEGYESFLDFHAPNKMHEYKITDLKSRVKKGVLQVQVTTARPGLLIGKAGRNIDRIKNELEKEFGLKVRIYIIENPLTKQGLYI